MNSLAKQTIATVIPCLRYRNAPAAIDWLCRAFGFEKQMVYPGEGNTILHAQLTFGNGMIMLGSVMDNEFGQVTVQPDEIGGRETQCAYLVVEDVDALAERAKAAGAQTVTDVKDEDYGGRSYACRDLEGHMWYFGTYDPWNSEATTEP